jgi:hypothetical protein
MRRRVAVRLLALYPRSWRRRYQAEVGALLELHQVRFATLADLVAGAVDARLHRAYESRENLMTSSDRDKRRRNTRCSFCGKGQDQVKKLIAGPGVYICDACVVLCNQVLNEDARRPGKPGCESSPPRRNWRVSAGTWLRNIFRSTVPHPTG